MKGLEVEIGGLKLKNPVMVASGTFAYGDELKDSLPVRKLGAVVTKGISVEPKFGNPPPRLFETSGGLLNSIGLENMGVEKFLKEKLSSLLELNVPIIVNIFGETEKEYVTLAKSLNGTDISALELNLSCPNTERGGMEFGKDPDIAKRITEKVKEVTDKPVFAKLAPNFTDIVEVAKAVEKGGADAITLSNTIMGMAVNVDSMEFFIPRGVAGLSGPAIRPIVLYLVYRVYPAVKIPIIGVGGIMDTHSALEYILSGSRAVQVGTGLFIDPYLPFKIIKGIKEYIKEKKTDLKTLEGFIHKKEKK